MKKEINCPICYSIHISKAFDLKDYFLTKEDFSIWKCHDCDLLFTHPKPEIESLSRYYESPDYLSHDTEHSGILGKFYKFIREINIKRKFKIVNQLTGTGKILDIGCGTGELLNYFQKQNWSSTGIEPNSSARKFARFHYKLNIEEENHLQKLPLSSFDIISMWHVLEHVPDVNERIEVVKQLLKPDGYLVIALPNPVSYDRVFYGQYWAGFDVPRHLYHFSPNALHNLAHRHGLKVIETLPMKFDAYYVSLLSERYMNHRFPIFRAAFRGFLSNRSASKSGNYSSLIYILKKNRNG